MNDCFVIFLSKICNISQSDLHDVKERERIIEQMGADVRKTDDMNRRNNPDVETTREYSSSLLPSKRGMIPVELLYASVLARGQQTEITIGLHEM